MTPKLGFFLFALSALVLPACGSGADKVGVATECASNDDCPTTGDDEIVLECLTGFKGGYCGLTGCTEDADCPESSICVTHDDNQNYCFRTCENKDECNRNRSADNEANCSSNITRVGTTSSKACVPPSA